jgi:alkylated DNA repair dioxygenase AlkB
VIFTGSGEVAVSGRKIDIRGDIGLHLPPDARVEDVLDVESFRHHVAVSAGRLPEPPVVPVAELTSVRLGVPGLTYVQNFLSDLEEAEIVEKIDQNDWQNDLKRRVQHYGWRYDYVNRQIDPGMRIDKLPDWAIAVAERLVKQKIVPQMPDQLIVNEYVRDQGIGRHIDREPDFADDIAMISLLESWEMVFRRKDNSKIKHNVMLDNRSVAVMSGPARYQWTHEIPSRKSEPGPKMPNGRRQRKLRKRRLSLTFRKVLDENLRK